MLLSVRQVAALTGIHPSNIRTRAKRGHYRGAQKVDSTYAIPVESLPVDEVGIVWVEEGGELVAPQLRRFGIDLRSDLDQAAAWVVLTDDVEPTVYRAEGVE